MRHTLRTAVLVTVAATIYLTAQLPSAGQVAEQMRLFRIVTAQGDVLLGLSDGELALLGSGPEVERIARRIVQEGHLTAWRYIVTRAPDGTTRLATRDRVALLRQEALVVEPYAAALPVAPPPAQ